LAIGMGYSSVLKMGAMLSSETSMNLYQTTMASHTTDLYYVTLETKSTVAP
jgi:hypothetical protein